MAREVIGLAAVTVAIVMILGPVLAIVFGVHVDHPHNDHDTAIVSATGNTNSSAFGGE